MSLYPDPRRLGEFFYWVNERHSIWEKRVQGERKPWTNDPILRDNKFTNVFRQLDRGSRWLIESWLKPRFSKPHNIAEAGLLAANIATYRMFNWWETGAEIGWQQSFSPVRIQRKLGPKLARGEKVFTSAHIIRSEFGRPKLDSVLDILKPIWAERTTMARVLIRSSATIEGAFNLFMRYPFIGEFMAYEFATDLTYTWVLDGASDRMTWANPGPGATRGLRYMWEGLKGRDELIWAMRFLLAMSQKPGVLGARVPSLEMRDIEMSLCEVYKYWKIKDGSGQARVKYDGRTNSMLELSDEVSQGR